MVTTAVHKNHHAKIYMVLSDVTAQLKKLHTMACVLVSIWTLFSGLAHHTLCLMIAKDHIDLFLNRLTS